MGSLVMASALGVFLAATAQADSVAAPTFQELMHPKSFPKAQCGMEVKWAKLERNTVRIRTTGADISVRLGTGEVMLAQRIGHQRTVAVLRLGRKLVAPLVTHSGPGFARVTFAEPLITIRVNGDSLFMLHAHEPLGASVDRKIDPAWHASYGSNHLIADELGAFGLFCSQRDLKDDYNAYAPTVAAYPLPADAVLCVGVCPPKPYDWDRSLKDNVVWHWSNKLGYPPDGELKAWKQHGNIVLLQSEVMLWKDWNLAFVPRLGVEEFARVRETIHDLGMRFIVYTSPYYFLKGTPLEDRAMNSFKDFKGWPPGSGTGENMGLFLPEIRKVMKEYRPDGLYFDGQYVGNPAALYALAREARETVGEDGILEWHSTGALGSQHCYLPQADAYVDFILRGEGLKGVSDDYLRFFVSGYNVNNSIGVLCNNVTMSLTPELVARVLRVNGRFHTLARWTVQPEVVDLLERHYRAKLTPELRLMVEQGVDDRQARVKAAVAQKQKEWEQLRSDPQWGEAAFAVEFDKAPDGQRLVSTHNAEPFSVEGGVLRVRAHAHTFAYSVVPLDGRFSGFVVKIRHGTDGGMSWGPAAMMLWADGASVRIGTRSDGMLQSDILGSQRCDDRHDTNQWIWLRARWLGASGVIERSDDGVDYKPVRWFEHDGLLNKPAAALLVGKVPYNGEPKDHSEKGEPGECEIDFVRLHRAR